MSIPPATSPSPVSIRPTENISIRISLLKMTLCFATAAPVTSSLTKKPATSAHATPCVVAARAPRAELDLIPGVPPGEDARDNQPLRYYVPRPKETYDNRGFATILPRTWEGEVSTIGADDVSGLVEAETVVDDVDAESSGAFVDFAQMVKEERKEQLAELIARNEAEKNGRATCGDAEGKAFVSNYRTILVDGVKAVEYWGAPNGPVPRLFGGPTA